MHSNKVKEISLIGILAAVNIASRIYLQFLPNIKPVTSIIIISVMLFGLGFGVKLSIVTTIVSNLFLGMGTWTFFQILAWVVICLITQVLLDFLKKIQLVWQKPLFPAYRCSIALAVSAAFWPAAAMGFLWKALWA